MSPRNSPNRLVSNQCSCRTLVHHDLANQTLAPLGDSAEPSTRPRLAKLGISGSDVHHLDPDELDLFTTWCTTTYKSLAQDPDSKYLWRNVISRKALQCSTTLDSLLALSALQLAFCHTHDCFRQKLLSAAQAHWARVHAALGREANRSSEATNCVSLFAQCSTQLVFSFAYSQLLRPCVSHSAIDRICGIFHETRRSNNMLLELLENSSSEGILSLLAPQGAESRMPHTAAIAILGLKMLNANTRVRQAHAVYNETIDQLNSCLAYTTHSTDPGIWGLSWILRVPSAYLDLVQSREPLALIILAHYCVVMYHLRERWWMGDWGVAVLQEISTVLGPDRQASIDWAMDATGTYPNTV